MTTQPIKHSIGIDVSKETLDVYILPLKQYHRFSNDAAGIKKLKRELCRLTEPTVVMEATGGYEKAVSQALSKADISTSIANPRHIRHFAQALGRLAKTDKLDAYVIALFAEKLPPKRQVVFNESQQTLADLQARRKQILVMLVMEKNRLDKASTAVKKSILKVVKALEEELASVDAELAKHIQSSQEQLKNVELLRTIKGVGRVVATGLITTLPELGQLSAKQIGALAGLAPFNCDSGNMRGRQMIWGGRSSVRNVLYMSTLVAIRHNAQIRVFYERLVQAGKAKLVAITACMRKLLTIMNAMLRDGVAWCSPVSAAT